MLFSTMLFYFAIGVKAAGLAKDVPKGKGEMMKRSFSQRFKDLHLREVGLQEREFNKNFHISEVSPLTCPWTSQNSPILKWAGVSCPLPPWSNNLHLKTQGQSPWRTGPCLCRTSGKFRIKATLCSFNRCLALLLEFTSAVLFNYSFNNATHFVNRE